MAKKDKFYAKAARVITDPTSIFTPMHKLFRDYVYCPWYKFNKRDNIILEMTELYDGAIRSILFSEKYYKNVSDRLEKENKLLKSKIEFENKQKIKFRRLFFKEKNKILTIDQSVESFITSYTDIRINNAEARDELAINLVKAGYIEITNVEGKRNRLDIVTVTASINLETRSKLVVRKLDDALSTISKLREEIKVLTNDESVVSANLEQIKLNKAWSGYDKLESRDQ